MSNPDIPLGTAEQCLLALSSINELVPRLHLWVFKLDYDQLERVRTPARVPDWCATLTTIAFCVCETSRKSEPWEECVESSLIFSAAIWFLQDLILDRKYSTFFCLTVSDIFGSKQ